jgi:hypothetical protein
MSELLFKWLKPFLACHPETLAMLEFTSPGRNRRQVDCALVGPGGIDLIEVKNKRGVVRGSADGEWEVEDHTGTVRFSNFKSGRPENPYDQATRTADDLEDGLRRLTRGNVRVTPLVLVPAPDPSSSVAPRHSRVALALNISELKRELRSADRQSGGGWDGFDFQELPRRLSLRPFDLAFVQGRIFSSTTRQGVGEVTVEIQGDGEVLSVQTDQFGRYTFSGCAQQTLRLNLVVPGRYLPPEVQKITLNGRFIEVADVILHDRCSEAELQQAYQAQESLLRQEFAARMAELGDRKVDEQVQMGFLLDGLTAALQRAQLRITTLEREASSQRPAGYTLAVAQPTWQLSSRQHQDERLRQEQQLQIVQALSQLHADRPQERRAAVNQATLLLAHLSLTSRPALPDSLRAALPEALTVTLRAPVELPFAELGDRAAQEADIVDVDGVLLPPSEPPVPSSNARPPSEGRRRLTVAGLAVLLLGMGSLAWMRLSPEGLNSGRTSRSGAPRGPELPAVSETTVAPSSGSVEHSGLPAEGLPGVPAERSDVPTEDVGNQGDMSLPGAPVTP